MQKSIYNRFVVTLIAIVILSISANAQAPQAIPYQAVVRNSAGNVVANKTVGLRFSIRDASATGTIVYQETQSAVTNALGLFVVNVGQGTLVFGYQSLTVINWQVNTKFLQVEIDTAGGTTFTNIGTQQLLSVPYALNAANGVPVGSVQAYMGTTAPAGWLMCDGSAISRTTYASLFAILSIASGTGDGTTTFNLPDMRGKFLRGVDGGTGYDPNAATRTANMTGGNTGNKVGSFQSHAYTSHNHTVTPGNGNYYGLYQSGGGSYGPAYGGGWSFSNVPQTDYSGGNETRPVNVYVNYIIKY